MRLTSLRALVLKHPYDAPNVRLRVLLQPARLQICQEEGHLSLRRSALSSNSSVQRFARFSQCLLQDSDSLEGRSTQCSQFTCLSKTFSKQSLISPKIEDFHSSLPVKQIENFQTQLSRPASGHLNYSITAKTQAIQFVNEQFYKLQTKLIQGFIKQLAKLSSEKVNIPEPKRVARKQEIQKKRLVEQTKNHLEQVFKKKGKSYASPNSCLSIETSPKEGIKSGIEEAETPVAELKKQFMGLGLEEEQRQSTLLKRLQLRKFLKTISQKMQDSGEQWQRNIHVQDQFSDLY